MAASQVQPHSTNPIVKPTLSSRLNFLTDNFNPILQLTNGPANQVDELRQTNPLTAALILKMQKGGKNFN